MSVFREKIEAKEPVEAPLEKKETPDKVEIEDDQDVVHKDIKNIEEYEIERGHKFAEKYFDVRNIVAEDKIMRMNIGIIDKYIKGLIEERGFSKTIDNYAHLINEIESKIGSSRLETFKRIQKIIGYIKVMQKYKKIKELKEKYVFQNNI